MANIVINDETFPGVASVTLNSTTDTATFLSTDYVLVGTPEVAETAADMTETDKIYVYVGSEEGYTAGNWYYFNGTSWASGGVFGSSGGGISNNARNLLKYILERVAYTETGMQTYVNALYEALKEQGGGGTTTYTIINVLDHVTNSNTDTGIDEGESYSATLTADTDYTIGSVIVTMGGVDVTSTVYSNGTITIASVTGDIVITATASSNVLYRLSSPFTSDGTTTLDTNVQLEVSKTYTFLCDFAISNLNTAQTGHSVDYIFGNRIMSNNYYLSLQTIKSNTNVPTCWGIGISWSNGSNLVSIGKQYRCAVIVTVNSDGSSSCAMNFKNVTDAGALQTFSNSYGAGCAITTNTYYLGKTPYDTVNTGFLGTVNDFQIHEGEMASADITDYLNNGA